MMVITASITTHWVLITYFVVFIRVTRGFTEGLHCYQITVIIHVLYKTTQKHVYENCMQFD